MERILSLLERFSGVSSFAETPPVILEGVTGLLGGCGGFVTLLRDGRCLDHGILDGQVLPLKERGWLEEVIRKDGPILIKASSPLPDPLTHLSDKGIGSIVATSLKGEGFRGAVAIFRREEAFDGDDLRTLSTLSACLSPVLEKVLIQEELKGLRSYWRGILQSIRDGVCVTDEQCRVIMCNQAFREMVGMRPDGRDCADVISALGIEELSCCSILDGKGRFEKRFRYRDRHLHLSVFPMEGGKGVVGILRDVTDEERLKESLLQSEKLAAVGTLVSGVAHELNNPLTSVIGYSQLLLSKDLDEGLRKAIERIAHEAERASKIVQRLLILGRRRAPERIFTEIKEIIGGVVDAFREKLEEKGIELRLSIADDLPLVMVDPVQFRQVLSSLLINAVEAIREAGGEGFIEVVAGRVPFEDGEGVEIVFRDSGPGVPSKIRGRIFEPFFTTKDVGKGTGLGLSTAYSIVKDHGGDLFLKESNEGATFVIHLPPAERGGGKERGGRRILAVDDETNILELVEGILVPAGYEVDKARGGKEALKKVEKGDYDLILLDVKMPVMSGIEFYRRLEEIRPELCRRVIFLTGDVVSRETMEFVKRSGRPLLAKPFQMEDLLKAVSNFFK